MVKAGDLKPKGGSGWYDGRRLRDRSTSPKAWQCAVSNTEKGGPGLEISRNTFFEAIREKLQLDCDLLKWRTWLETASYTSFGQLLFLNPFAGTHSGADYEQPWQLYAARLPVGYWSRLSLTFGAGVALCT